MPAGEFQRVTAHAQRPGNSETGHVGRDPSQIGPGETRSGLTPFGVK